MGRQQPEAKIQNASLLRVGQRPDTIIWRQHVGKYRHLNQPNLVVSIGTPGMADSLGVVAVTITPEMVGRQIGVAIAAEFKTATGKQAEAQRHWQQAFQARGGVYRVVRSPDEMEQLVEDVRNGKAW